MPEDPVKLSEPPLKIVKLRLPLNFEYQDCVVKILSELTQRGYYAPPADICVAYIGYCQTEWASVWMLVGRTVSAVEAANGVFRRLEVDIKHHQTEEHVE